MRAQFIVLKKAVVDEKAKNAEMSELIRKKEVVERKAESELDSLQFRNQQLTKRIQVLQDENHVPNEARGDDLKSVIGCELQAKIEENEKLHQNLSQIDAKYETLIGGYQSRIRELESKDKNSAQKKRFEESQQKDMIQGLKEDNVALQDKIQQLEGKLNQAKSHSPSMPLTFNESRIQSVELLSQINEYVTELVASFSDFHTYWQHRLKDDDQLSALLKDNVKHVKPIEETFQDALNKILSQSDPNSFLKYFLPFSQSLHDYVKYSLEVEKLTLPPNQFQTQLRSFNRFLNRLSEYVHKLTEHEEVLENVENINVVLSQLHRESIDLNRIFSELALDENEKSAALKNSNQCLVSAFSSMSASFGGLSRLISDHLPRIKNLVKLLPVPPKEEMVEEVKIEEIAFEEEVSALSKSVEELNEKLKLMEQSRDHWKLEYQLLEVKFNRINSEEEQNGMMNFSDEMKKVFEKKIFDLIAERLMSDGKAASLNAETSALKKRLNHSEKERTKLRSSWSEAEERCRLLAEEAALTAKNYEGQLSMMSEHLANMNERLTSQTEHIQALKKGGKKK